MGGCYVKSDAAFDLVERSWAWLEDELVRVLEGELSADQVRAAFQVARMGTFGELAGAWSELETLRPG